MQNGLRSKGRVFPIGIFVLQRVVRMGIRREHAVEFSFFEQLDVLLAELIEESLLTNATNIVARVLLFVEEDAEVHPRLVQDLGSLQT